MHVSEHFPVSSNRWSSKNSPAISVVFIHSSLIYSTVRLFAFHFQTRTNRTLLNEGCLRVSGPTVPFGRLTNAEPRTFWHTCGGPTRSPRDTSSVSAPCGRVRQLPISTAFPSVSCSQTNPILWRFYRENRGGTAQTKTSTFITETFQGRFPGMPRIRWR